MVIDGHKALTDPNMTDIGCLIGSTDTGITPVVDTTNTETITGSAQEAEGELEIAIHITILKGTDQEAGRNTEDIILLIEIEGIMIRTIGPAKTTNQDGPTAGGVIMVITSNTAVTFIHVILSPIITEIVTPTTIKIMEARKKENTIMMAAQERKTMNVALNARPITTAHLPTGHENDENEAHSTR